MIRHRGQMAFLVFMLLVLLAVLNGCVEYPLEQVVANIRQATGIVVTDSLPTHVHGVIEARGTIRQAGDQGAYRLYFDRAGAIREEAHLRIDYTTVMKDTLCWGLESSGDTRKLALNELEHDRLWLGILTGRWLVPDAGYEITLLSGSASKVKLSVGIPGGLRSATVIVDTLSWLPNSFSYPTNAGRTTRLLSDYREVAGRQLAHRIVRDWDGPDEEIQFDSAAVLQDPPDSLFVVPAAHLVDYRFDPDLPPEVETRVIDTGHVLVQPVINGRKAGWFFLDTGAGVHVISPRMAAMLELEAFGAVEATGTGGTIMADFRQADQIRLGPMTMDNPVMAAIDLSGIIPGIDGIIGYPLFRRAVVEINPGDQPVRVFPPDEYPGDVSEWEDLLLARRHCYVQCRFEGDREGLFCLDTGHRGAATFHTPAVNQYDLLAGRKTWKASGTGGVGGPSNKRRGKLEWFEIGGVRFTEPVVDFSRAKHGGFYDPYSVGHVGMGLLYYFRIVIDYPRSRLAFIPGE